MAFNLDEIVSRGSVAQYYDIPVTKENLIFLYNSGAIAPMRRLNDLLRPVDGGAGAQCIRIKKHFGLNVQEDAGMRGDRYNTARRLELTAAIGRETGCKETEAQDILITESRWSELSNDLRTDLKLWFLSYMAETSESSLPARQVTTVIQNRLDSDWRLEWTLQLPAVLQKHFLDFIEGENKGWPDPELPLLSSSNSGAIDLDAEPEGETGSPATNGKRMKSAAVV